MLGNAHQPSFNNRTEDRVNTRPPPQPPPRGAITRKFSSPKNSKGPFPCVIFLHGNGDDKEFMAENKLDEQFVKAG